MPGPLRPTPLELAGTLRLDDDTWILHYGIATNPLPLNGSRGASYHRRAAISKSYRVRTRYLAMSAKIPPLRRCTAQLTWWVATTRTRDVDNLAAFEKPLFDGLVDAAVVVDDSPTYMTKPRGVIRPVADSDGLVTRACFTLTVTRQGTDA